MFITYSYRFLISRILSSFLTTYWPFTSSVSIYAIHFLRSPRCCVAIIFPTWLNVSHMQYSYMKLLSPVPQEALHHLSLCHATRDIAWTSRTPKPNEWKWKKIKRAKDEKRKSKNRLQYKTEGSNQTQSMIVSGSALSHRGAPRLPGPP